MTTRSVDSVVPGMADRDLMYPPFQRNKRGELGDGTVGTRARSCPVTFAVVREAFSDVVLIDDQETSLRVTEMERRMAIDIVWADRRMVRNISPTRNEF